jgi:hypothetical protein
MARMLGNNDVAFESARSQFWIVDAHVSWITKNHLTIHIFAWLPTILYYPLLHHMGMITLSRNEGLSSYML